jgi:hypothetical protein
MSRGRHIAAPVVLHAADMGARRRRLIQDRGFLKLAAPTAAAYHLPREVRATRTGAPSLRPGRPLFRTHAAERAPCCVVAATTRKTGTRSSGGLGGFGVSIGEARRQTKSKPRACESKSQAADGDGDCVGEIGVGDNTPHDSTQDRTENEPDHGSKVRQVTREGTPSRTDCKKLRREWDGPRSSRFLRTQIRRTPTRLCAKTLGGGRARRGGHAFGAGSTGRRPHPATTYRQVCAC